MEKATSLEFLQAVYTNEGLPLFTRMRAAVACLPFEYPKLQAHAFIPPGGDFAQQLDRRLARRRELKLIEAKPINGEGPKTDLTMPPPIPDRRFRRRV
jgi:hypothetical protein